MKSICYLSFVQYRLFFFLIYYTRIVLFFYFIYNINFFQKDKKIDFRKFHDAEEAKFLAQEFKSEFIIVKKLLKKLFVTFTRVSRDLIK